MKGKVNLISRITFFVIAILTATLCGVISLNTQNKNSFAALAQTKPMTDVNASFSAVDENNVFFSVEKVAVSASENKFRNEGTNNQVPIVDNLTAVSTTANFLYMQNAEGKYYQFEPIANVEKGTNKFVVYDNEFVMLNNSVVGGVYYSPAITGADKQEAIMVSLGQYNIDPNEPNNLNKIEIRDNKTGGEGEITNIVSFVAKLNGENSNIVPAFRQFGDSGEYEDLAFIIPQRDDTEGFWEFEFTYRYAEKEFTQKFQFYLVFETSYTETDNQGINGEYSAYPTFEETKETGSTENFIYDLGSNNNYPTLTYDYTRYKMSYVHTANGIRTSYSFDFKKDEGTLDYTIESSGKELSESKTLTYYTNDKTDNNYIVFVFTEMGYYEFSFDYLYDGEVKENMNLPSFNKTLKIRGFETKYSKFGYDEAQLRYVEFSKSENKLDVIKADLFVPNGKDINATEEEQIKVLNENYLGVVYSLTENVNETGTVLSSKDASVNLSNYYSFEMKNPSGSAEGYYIQDGKFFVEATGNVDASKTYFAKSATATLNNSIDIITEEIVNKANQTFDVGNSKHVQVLSLLSNLKGNYVKTNQGSIWLTTTDNYVQAESFYFYNKDAEIGYSDLFVEKENNPGTFESTSKKITNTTEFNKSGYYLVFVAVDLNSNDSFETANGDFYQVFAFQYTTDTINISVVTDDEDKAVVGAGKYTNKNVKVYWDEPGIFDRAITASYYFDQSRDADVVLNSSAYELNSGDTLGYEVTDAASKLGWATYVVEVKSEGKATTTRMFTIDTQPISGVSVYAVEPWVDANNIRLYKFAQDKETSELIAKKAISDSASTLYWNDKESEANVTVKYSFTPFVKNTESTFKVGEVRKDNNANWITTNYTLGNTVVGLEIFKAVLNGDVYNPQVFSQQGIYTFRLTDEAGNTCTYMFVIDKSEAYFRIDTNPSVEVPNGEDIIYTTRTSELFASKIEYSVGTHKVIDIAKGVEEMRGNNKVEEHYEMINAALTSSKSNEFLAGIKDYYYDYQFNIGNNTNELVSLFQTYTDGGDAKQYIAVKNNSVLSLTSEGQTDNSTAIQFVNVGAKQTIDHVEGSLSGTSTIRSLYIHGENQNGTTNAENSNSKIVVEINKDNSLGMVFASDIKFSDIPQESIDVIRVLTDDEITLAHATSNKYAAFRWNVGVGEFEVESVSYKYYEFNQTLNSYSNELYFYKSEYEEFDLFKADKYTGATLVDDKAYGVLNESNGMTAEGLYVITRTYKNTGADLGGDKLELSYYFIVDRHGIIDGAAGSGIKIKLLDNETTFDEFDVVGAEPGKIHYMEKVGDKDVNVTKNYQVFLTTNKVPATVYVPIGKYFNEIDKNYSNYYAGRLKFSVYFNDVSDNKHFDANGGAYKLFEITEGETFNTENYTEDGYYKIDFASNLSNLTSDQKGLFGWNGSTFENDWLHLSGDYVIVITDLVENSNSKNSNETIIAFRVKHSDPVADIYVTIEQNSTVAVDRLENNTITTNQEFVKLEIAAKDINSTSAEIDSSYLIVEKWVGETEESLVKNNKDYINYEYGKFDPNKSEHNLTDNTAYPIFSNNGNYTIFLDTGLERDENGKIINWVENIIQYKVTVRYRLWIDENDKSEKYKDCYTERLLDGEIKEYYYNTFYITIDRRPPEENTNHMVANDKLISIYNLAANIENENTFVTEVYETSRLDFARQYNNYYQLPKRTEELYVFQVNSNTTFSNKDISKVYVSNAISKTDLATMELSLPIISSIGFNEIKDVSSTTNYGQLLTNAGVYQVVEFDKAGNMTQYLVEFEQNLGVKFDFNIKFTNGKTYTAKLSNGAVQFIDANGNVATDIVLNGNDLPFFGLNEISVETDESMYIVEISDALTSEHILVDLTTNPNDITKLIKEKISTFGTYKLTISTRTQEVNYFLTYADEMNVLALDLEKMVDKDTYSIIDLAGANFTDGDKVAYYLTSIQIVYYKDGVQQEPLEFYTDDGGVTYKNKATDEVVENNLIDTLKDGNVYIISAIDSLGRTPATFKFKSGDPSYVYYSINFGEDTDGDGLYDGMAVEKDGKYYALQKTTVKYDFTAFEKAIIRYSVNNARPTALTINSKTDTELSQNYASQEIVSVKLNSKTSQAVVELFPYFAADGLGTVLNFDVELYQFFRNSTPEKTYSVVLDTVTGEVRLKDNTTDEDSELWFAANVDIASTTYGNPTTGEKTLIWSLNESEIFDYSYDLYESVNTNGSVVLEKTSLNDKNGSFKISPKQESTGEYRFVISILDKNGNVLGTKIYTFAVKFELNKVYYVEYYDGEKWVSMESNTTFTTNDLTGMTIKGGIPTYTDPIPLFIKNSQMRYSIINDEGITVSIYEAENLGDYKFSIYQLSAETYTMYFGLLQVPTTESLINRISATAYTADGGVSGSVAMWTLEKIPDTINGTVLVGDKFKLSILSRDLENPILNKNKLIVDVRYDGSLVDTLNFARGSAEVEINGNGSYRFFVKDEAGNMHIFNTVYDEDGFEYIEATILQEVEISINGTAPVNKAYYNEFVEFSVVNRANYEQGTISWVATRNGQEYASSSTTYSYKFEDYGTYRLVVTALPKGVKNTKENMLRKVIVFTIVNQKEARKSFDLTSLSGYDIKLIEDNEGKDVTSIFKNMLATSDSGMLVTYEMLLANEELNIGAGKQTFTVHYRVSEGLYPTRNITFQFTMNNETPYIECSLKPGDTTTKGFTISFNPGIIYKQIGESAIYINGELVLEIDETSSTELMKKKFTQKVHGKGDYYISIQSSSGDVISTFKVTIKEPLNTSAIIIIVVASVVIIGVVVTIIVLRNKMKIR